MTNAFYSQFAGNAIKSSVLSVEVLRDALLPNLLGDDRSGILYWAGKDLARQFPVAADEDLVTFFEQCGWGHLIVEQAANDLITYELTGEPVARRSFAIKDPDFMLETGFLAEQASTRFNCVSEAKITFQNKMRIRIAVTIDHDQPLLAHDPATPIEIVRPEADQQPAPDDAPTNPDA
ncbi:YslB family protein [Lactiplantibacillus sp. WILCCON 0030]|uniref:YslB family protein n=1 Tax=Lactiplantibacillus brownii TaxID=3069269 RepID=A0ABU1A9U5_9LACO|nr:YslB family protein [Lactiplantibacillus brownii]MDQ7937704.1 YslB family protein [Lactiplantibacillus brownii]